MTLLGGAVYAGFFALATVWLAATNPDAAEARAQANTNRQDLVNSADTAATPVGPSPCCAGQASL